MKGLLPVRAQADGTFLEDFLVKDDEYILRRRIGNAGQERLRLRGFVVERYKTDGKGNRVLEQQPLPGLPGDDQQPPTTARSTRSARTNPPQD